VTEEVKALVDECQRQSENCAYTSTSFIIWLRSLRRIRTACAVGAIFFGAVATWKVVAQDAPAIGAVSAFLATVIPLAYRAARIDGTIAALGPAAGEFTNLRDRFRQAALIYSHKPFPEFTAEAKLLRERLEKARQQPLTPPEWCFKLARWKHKAGHYQSDYDASQSGSSPR
jgi:hypothetical protein